MAIMSWRRNVENGIIVGTARAAEAAGSNLVEHMAVKRGSAPRAACADAARSISTQLALEGDGMLIAALLYGIKFRHESKRIIRRQ